MFLQDVLFRVVSELESVSVGRVGGLKRPGIGRRSHVGLVVEAGDGTKCICEAHAAGDASYLGNDRGGVFTYTLTDRLDAYPGDVYVARLKTPLDRRQKQDLIESLDSFGDAAYDTHHRWHYVTHCLLGMKSARCRREIFCSELVARALRDAGIFDAAGLSPSCCTPEDIAFNTGAYRDLRKYRSVT